MKYPHIRSIKIFEPKQANDLTIFYMMGYGGRIWHAKRQIKHLASQGYVVHAIDFKFSLAQHDPNHLLELMDEVQNYIHSTQVNLSKVTLIGISLGGLASYNMLRREPRLKRAVFITGGNIAMLPSNYSLKKNWKMTKQELEDAWMDVNIFTKPGIIKGKSILMLLPKRDRTIEPKQIISEFEIHKKHNNLILPRTPGGHFRTIITETMIRPKKIDSYLAQLDD